MKNGLWVALSLLMCSTLAVGTVGSTQETPSTPRALINRAKQAAELSTTMSAADSLPAMAMQADKDSADAGDTKRAHLESTVFRRETPIEYESGGRRDPFRPLIVDAKKRGDEEEEQEDSDLLRVEGSTLTGVVWAQGLYLALIKDKDGRNFFLHDGDAVYRGHVVLVTQSETSIEITDFGDYRKITLKVRAKDESKDHSGSKDKG